MGSLNPYPPPPSATPFTLPPSPSPASSSLPILLCLHGGGSNNQVFRFQCRRIERLLRHRYRFVYPNATIPSKPGFDIVPIFESAGPFYRWVSDRGYNKPSGNDEEDIQNAPITATDEALEIDRIIREAVREATASDKTAAQSDGLDKVVGIMGFSQGAILTSGLICREHDRRTQPYPTTTLTPTTTPALINNLPLPSLGFGVVIGGPSPPIFLHPPPSTSSSSPSPISSSSSSSSPLQTAITAASVSVSDRLSGLRTIPTLHAWARSDHVRPGCEALARLTDSPKMAIFNYEGRHHLPLTDAETEALVTQMLDCSSG